MALLDLLAQLTTQNPKNSNRNGWSLKNNDTGQIISGQYLPEGYQENVTANFQDITTTNIQEPFNQWINGNAETANFKVRIFTHSPLLSVKNDIETLKKSIQRDARLNRPPNYIFTYGTEISYFCNITNVAPVEYDEIDNTVGTIRGARFTLGLRKLTNLPTGNELGSFKSDLGIISGVGSLIQDISNLIFIPGGSLHTKSRTISAKQGDTFESLAQREYGDALVGDILRRTQPEKADLKPGDDVIMVDDTEVFQIKVTPQSHMLKDNSEVRALKEIKFANRNRPTVKVI